MPPVHSDIKAGGSLPGRTANAGQTRSRTSRRCFEKPGSQIEPDWEREPEPRTIIRFYRCGPWEGFGKIFDILRGKGFKLCKVCGGLGRFVDAPTEEAKRKEMAKLWKNIRSRRDLKKKRKPLNFKSQGGKS